MTHGMLGGKHSFFYHTLAVDVIEQAKLYHFTVDVEVVTCNRFLAYQAVQV